MLYSRYASLQLAAGHRPHSEHGRLCTDGVVSVLVLVPLALGVTLYAPEEWMDHPFLLCELKAPSKICHMRLKSSTD